MKPTTITPYGHGYSDGYNKREYGWANDDDWGDLEHDHYESGYTSGANDRRWEPERREYYRGDRP